MTDDKILIRQKFIFPSDFMTYNLSIIPTEDLPVNFKLVISGEPTIRKYKKKIKLKNLDITEKVDNYSVNYQRITLNIPMGMLFLKERFLSKVLPLIDNSDDKLPLITDLIDEFEITTKVVKSSKKF